MQRGGQPFTPTASLESPINMNVFGLWEGEYANSTQTSPSLLADLNLLGVRQQC